LFKKSHISFVSALLLLLLFAVSITPKKVWHDLFAVHEHTVVVDNDASKSSVQPQTVKCSFPSDDIISPFIHAEIKVVIQTVKAYQLYKEEVLSFNLVDYHNTDDSRGPPFFPFA
jgi:hypothetical protein